MKSPLNVYIKHIVAAARNDAARPLDVEDLLLVAVPDLQLLVPPGRILYYLTKVIGSRVDHQHLRNRKSRTFKFYFKKYWSTQKKFSWIDLIFNIIGNRLMLSFSERAILQ